MVTRSCPKCTVPFDYEPVMLAGREIGGGRICEACIQASNEDAEQRRISDREAKKLAGWHDVCPALYRDTDLNRLPLSVRGAVEAWNYGARGLGLVGEAGLCKTRGAFELLRRQYFDGKSCGAISAAKFARVAVDQFADDPARKGEAKFIISKLPRYDLLLIDDIGKGTLSERPEMELFDLLEIRTSEMLPTIWTANHSGDELLAKLSSDRGEPIMRRLVEFSDIPKLNPNH